MSDSLWPHELQHARPPCPRPTPGDNSNSCPLSQWCHSANSSSVVPFSSCPQSFPASGSFPMSQLFSWGGQRIGVLASASVLQLATKVHITFPPAHPPENRAHKPQRCCLAVNIHIPINLDCMSLWLTNPLWHLCPNILSYFINSSNYSVLFTQSCPTLCLSVHGISQAEILEWHTTSSSTTSSQSRDQTWVSSVSCIAGGFFTHCHLGSPHLIMVLTKRGTRATIWTAASSKSFQQMTLESGRFNLSQ